MTTLRREQPEDAPTIREVHRAAFGRADEADLVDALRDAGAAVLSLVAADDGGGEDGDAAGGHTADDGAGGAGTGQVIGHVLYTWVTVDTPEGEQVPLLGLAPVAVLPERQNEGIGTRLVEASLEWLREEGYAAVVVVGHPGFYPRFGFVPASRWELEWEMDVPDEAFMAMELNPGGLSGVRGVVRFRPEFAGV